MKGVNGGINLMGTVTDDGETLVLECGGSFTSYVTAHLLEVLTAEFGVWRCWPSSIGALLHRLQGTG